MSRRCIVLTATILPNIDHPTDPLELELRRREYLDGLRLYSALLPDPIFLVENSAYPLEDDSDFLAELDRLSVTLMRVPPSRMAARGKGYQEFEMVDQWVARHAEHFGSFIKITGRYLFPNLAEIVGPPSPGIVIDRLRRRRVAITSLFHVDSEFYRQHLTGVFARADDRDGRWIERVFYEVLDAAEFRGRVVLFPRTPLMSGRLGTGGVVHRSGRAGRTRVRNLERRLLRRLSISELYL